MRNLFILSMMSLLIGCGTTGTGAPSDDKLDQEEVSSTESEVQEEDFIYRLVTEKEEYDQGSDVQVYAELEYVGDEDSVEITHAASPFYFPIYEVSREYDIGYSMNEPLLTTVLKKGEPLREEYTGSGGFSGEDSEEFKEFIQQVMDGDFPKGFYEVHGYTNFNYKEQNYQLDTKVQFKLKN
ncbi:hypothetical protein [Piscibacillus halophilus]|uniref:Uncharacterized protein n=1 Tax=Piscibacillus halophilus TaxID=571933 RepID=A0A1H9CHI1_9BACI|nr:hypothetical protein [Piscibacillus halophilus]SEQ00690.1 hypothetical protein SAMN05216362_10572 [Piscibacillus halophilus]